MPPFMAGLKNGMPPPRPFIELMVTVEPIGNCVCGLKEPFVLDADDNGVTARSPPKAKSSRIPAVVGLTNFSINLTG